MIDETALVAAICNSREAFDRAENIGVECSNFGDAGGFVYAAAREQYGRDRNLSKIDMATLTAQISRRYGEGSMARSLVDFVATFPKDTSAVNVVEEYRLLRVARTATELATNFATGQFGAGTDELLERYQLLRSGSGEEEQSGPSRLTIADFKDKAGERLRIFPDSLNNYIGGGVLRGHNITVYGRPDSGKSLFTLNLAACVAMHGLKVLYVANEEPSRDLTRRLLARMAKVEISKLHNIEAIETALDFAAEDYENWYLYHKAGVTIQDIKREANKIRPDFIIVDQLKNVAIKEDNRALQLDKLARQVRELGIELDAVTISVTQAGESGQNKLVLGMSDIEWSNTGIPGAADLLIGIGVDDEYDNQGKRMISLPKNKINGRHGAFPVWIDPTHTAFMSRRKA